MQTLTQLRKAQPGLGTRAGGDESLLERTDRLGVKVTERNRHFHLVGRQHLPASTHISYEVENEVAVGASIVFTSALGFAIDTGAAGILRYANKTLKSQESLGQDRDADACLEHGTDDGVFIALQEVVQSAA